MSETTSNNSTLYFLVGGILVAVLAIGFWTFGRDGGTATNATPSVAAKAPAADTGPSFKLDVDKKGGVSGSIEQE